MNASLQSSEVSTEDKFSQAHDQAIRWTTPTIYQCLVEIDLKLGPNKTRVVCVCVLHFHVMASNVRGQMQPMHVWKIPWHGMSSCLVHGTPSVSKISSRSSVPEQWLLNVNGFYFGNAHLHWRNCCWLLTEAQKAISQAISSWSYRINVNKSLPFSKEIPTGLSASREQSNTRTAWLFTQTKAVQVLHRSSEITVLTGSLWFPLWVRQCAMPVHEANSLISSVSCYLLCMCLFALTCRCIQWTKVIKCETHW